MLRDEVAPLDEVERIATLARNGIESAAALSTELNQLERELGQLEDKMQADPGPSPTRKRARLGLTDDRRRIEDPDQWLRDVRAERRRVTELLRQGKAAEVSGSGGVDDTDDLPRLARELDEMLATHEAAIVEQSRKRALDGLRHDHQVRSVGSQCLVSSAKIVSVLFFLAHVSLSQSSLGHYTLVTLRKVGIASIETTRFDKDLNRFAGELMETLLQVTLDTERIRVPEILYQPHIIGSSACGLSEILEHTFAQFSPAVAENLAANVFLTGQEVRPLFFLSLATRSRVLHSFYHALLSSNPKWTNRVPLSKGRGFS